MKFLLIFSIFLVTVYSNAQSITVTATRQHWAGGACCQTGTNYTIEITGSLDSLKKTEINYAMIDGHHFFINQLADNKNELKIFHFDFKLVIDHRKEIIADKKIEIVDTTKFKENYVLISYNNQEMKIPLEKIEDLFYLAYP